MVVVSSGFFEYFLENEVRKAIPLRSEENAMILAKRPFVVVVQ